MATKRWLVKGATGFAALGMICCAASMGCTGQRHLVGTTEDASSTGADDGGGAPATDSVARGTGGAPVAGLDANGGTDSVLARDAGAAGDGYGAGGIGGISGSGGAYGGTVVSLGDKSSLGWPLAITPEEVARRLSTLMLNRPPSAALTAAIVAKAPKTNEDVGELADGLLLNETSANGRSAFYRWWLGLDRIVFYPDVVLSPALTPAVRTALQDATVLFAEDVTWQPQGNLTTLLTQPAAFITTATAPWFPGAVGDIQANPTRVTLDGTRFAGIVTQPAVLAAPTINPPVGRGARVRSLYMCSDVPPPPANVNTALDTQGGTARSRLEKAINTEPVCAVCHRLIDQPGFAFGHFAPAGDYQETENGLAIDTAGTLLSTSGGDVPFTGAPALALQLSKLPEVRDCYARQWLRFVASLLGYSPRYPDNDAIAPDVDYVVRRATVAGQLNLRGTIRAVTETHTFLDPR